LKFFNFKNMARPYGAKNKKRHLPINCKKEVPVMTEKLILEKIAERQGVVVSKLPTLSKVAKLDREYLMNMYSIFEATVSPTVPEEFPQDINLRNRFEPAFMWNNINAYFKASLIAGQPLTISGMAMFSGIPLHTIHDMSHRKNLHPAYHFVLYCRQFLEMYNEYQVHKKQNPAGAIFVLKNFGWKDKIEMETTLTVGALSEVERTEAQKRMQNFSE